MRLIIVTLVFVIYLAIGTLYPSPSLAQPPLSNQDAADIIAQRLWTRYPRYDIEVNYYSGGDIELKGEVSSTAMARDVVELVQNINGITIRNINNQLRIGARGVDFFPATPEPVIPRRNNTNRTTPTASPELIATLNNATRPENTNPNPTATNTIINAPTPIPRLENRDRLIATTERNPVLPPLTIPAEDEPINFSNINDNRDTNISNYTNNNPYPNNAYPNNAYTNNAYPNNGYPNNAYTNNAYPNNGYPNNAYPNNGYPTNGYPNNGYPNNAYPNYANVPPVPRPAFRPAVSTPLPLYAPPANANNNYNYPNYPRNNGVYYVANNNTNNANPYNPAPTNAGYNAIPASNYGENPYYGSTGPMPSTYSRPNLPPYAWPTYAAYPNYAQVSYPRSYSMQSWPYIGPFYSYPQAPLGWRQVTLKYDHARWWLDFNDGEPSGPLSPLFRQSKGYRY
ncbi:MAG: hypothetical protein LBB88_03715 [Planctomycetaceae bacterium]|jgi:hypothetical protein|nr:hypothetical protein [Planctomycetaceae bacterium]